MSRVEIEIEILIVLTIALAICVACSTGGSKVSVAKPGTSPTPSFPIVTVSTVISQELSRQIRLPGELQAYQEVMLYPRVQGFVEWIGVDRGSTVRAGQLLVRLSAPEFGSQRSEAEARVGGAQAQKLEAEAQVSSVRAQRAEAQARLAASAATYNRLKAASATPGVVSGNELENAQRVMEADQARLKAYDDNEKVALAQVRASSENEAALRAAVRSVQTTESYLKIVAPFDGVVTDRFAHKGSLAGPAGAAAAQPVLRLQQVSRLRLLVPVPEALATAVRAGSRVNFTVPAFPGETFTGTIARIGGSVDPRTRTMPVELEVANPRHRLAPGMFPQVVWPSERLHPSLLVPPSSVTVTTERTFVIRIHEGVARWVDVKRGVSVNQQGIDLVEVFGDLAPGDQIVLRGTDELREGTRVQINVPAK